MSHKCYHPLIITAFDGFRYVTYQLSILILTTTLKEPSSSNFTNKKSKAQDLNFQGYVWMFIHRSVIIQHPSVKAKFLGMLMNISLQRKYHFIYRGSNILIWRMKQNKTKQKCRASSNPNKGDIWRMSWQDLGFLC